MLVSELIEKLEEYGDHLTVSVKDMEDDSLIPGFSTTNVEYNHNEGTVHIKYGTWQPSHEQIVNWCDNVDRKQGGSFLNSFAHTYAIADEHNRILLKPVLVQLMEKYPQYK